MKRWRLAIISPVVALAVGLIGGMVFSHNRKVEDAESRIAEMREKLDENREAAAVRAGIAQSMEEVVSELTHDLTNSTYLLGLSSRQIDDERAAQDHMATGEVKIPATLPTSERFLGDTIPEPAVSVAQRSDGKKIKTFKFPVLLNPAGYVLAKDATFRAAYGEKMIFRIESGELLNFSVRDIHDAILAHLSIDRDEALRLQSYADERRKEYLDSARQRSLARKQLELKAARQMEELAALEKAGEARRQQQMDKERRRTEERIRLAREAMRDSSRIMGNFWSPGPNAAPRNPAPQNPAPQNPAPENPAPQNPAPLN